MKIFNLQGVFSSAQIPNMRTSVPMANFILKVSGILRDILKNQIGIFS